MNGQESCERGGGYDGFRVSADLERETFKWLMSTGAAASARTMLSDETMAKVARRFGEKRLVKRRCESTWGGLISGTSYSGKQRSRLGGRPASDPAQSGNAKLSPLELA